MRWWSCCRGSAAGTTPMRSGGQRHAVRAMPGRGDFDRAWRSKALRQALQPDHGCRSRHGWNRYNRRRLRGHGDSRRRRVPSAWWPCPCLAASTCVAAVTAKVRPCSIRGPLRRRTHRPRQMRQHFTLISGWFTARVIRPLRARTSSTSSSSVPPDGASPAELAAAMRAGPAGMVACSVRRGSGRR